MESKLVTEYLKLQRCINQIEQAVEAIESNLGGADPFQKKAMEVQTVRSILGAETSMPESLAILGDLRSKKKQKKGWYVDIDNSTADKVCFKHKRLAGKFTMPTESLLFPSDAALSSQFTAGVR